MIALLFLFSCNNDEKDLFTESDFKIGQSYTSGNKTYFEISQINDSRCAIGTTCVWEGEAKIFFKLTEGNNIKVDSTALKGKVAIKDTVFDNLIIDITSVDPYPEKDKIIKQSDYTVKMKVTKR